MGDGCTLEACLEAEELETAGNSGVDSSSLWDRSVEHHQMGALGLSSCSLRYSALRTPTLPLRIQATEGLSRPPTVPAAFCDKMQLLFHFHARRGGCRTGQTSFTTVPGTATFSAMYKSS